MVKVAIAGGTGDVGRTIVEVIKDSPCHQAVVLTRKPLDDTFPLPFIVVNYESIDDLKRSLEENNIHTVISTLGNEDGSLTSSQINLIKAADASKETIRFAPSAFIFANNRGPKEQFPLLDGYFRAIDELGKTKLQWTIFQNGLFMDYFAPGRPKSYLKPYPLVVDIANRIAAIPGDGNISITFTYSFDVAKFVVASLDLEHWPKESPMAGDMLTWNEVVRLAEEVTGSRFTVTHDDIAKLKKSEITELPIHSIVYKHLPKDAFQAQAAMLGLWFQDPKIASVPAELNAKFPGIHPWSVRGFLNRYWHE